jgi:hypothetical protein
MATDYTLNWSNNNLKAPFTLLGGTTNTTTSSLTLVGKGFLNWGEPIQENLLHILENFASDTAPAYPTLGQLWYDSTLKVLKVYIAASTWSMVYSLNSISSIAAPTNASTGQLWFDLSTAILKYYTGPSTNKWIPFYSATSLTSSSAPTDPEIGQLWYNPDTKRLSIRNNANQWSTVFAGDAISSAVSPTNPVIGQLWFDTSDPSGILKIYDKTLSFVPVTQSAQLIWDGLDYLLAHSLNVNGIVRANGFQYLTETTFTFSSNQTISFDNGNLWAGALNADSTVSLSASYPGHYQLRVAQDSAGGHNISWVNVGGWLGSVAAPSLNVASNGITYINFFRTKDGVWFGQIIKVGA